MLALRGLPRTVPMPGDAADAAAMSMVGSLMVVGRFIGVVDERAALCFQGISDIADFRTRVKSRPSHDEPSLLGLPLSRG